MIWAAFTLAFFVLFRVYIPGARNFSSQFNLTTDCVTFSPSLARPQDMLLKLKSSKTDSFKQGQSLVVAQCSSLLCPVSAMQRYFMLAQPQPGLLFYFQSGRLLTQSSVTHLLKDSARCAGLPYDSLKGHSFRIGAASAAGLPDWLIKVLGRWSSDCYQLYIRTPETVLLSAVPKMARVSGNFI